MKIQSKGLKIAKFHEISLSDVKRQLKILKNNQKKWKFYIKKRKREKKPYPDVIIKIRNSINFEIF